MTVEVFLKISLITEMKEKNRKRDKDTLSDNPLCLLGSGVQFIVQYLSLVMESESMATTNMMFKCSLRI